MPILSDRYFKPRRLHWWFALASLFMTGAIVWLIWVDHDRPWRRFQNEYFNNKAALAHLDYLIASAPGHEDRLRQLEHLNAERRYRGGAAKSGWLARTPIVRTIVNFPLADFVAPRDTPGHQQINQVILPGIPQRTEQPSGPTVERCTTCHVAVDDPALTQVGLARTMEQALPGVNHELERLGRARIGFPAPPVVVREDGAELDVGKVTEHWDWLTPEQRDTYFATLLKVTNEYLAVTGRDPIKVEPYLVAHPRQELFVAPDSDHPLSRMGCTLCHGGNPPETDFVLAAHTPPDPDVEVEWADHHYVRRLGLPTATFEEVASEWDRPMLTPRHYQAGCAACHKQVSDLSRFSASHAGAQLDLGRHLFASLGCANCHDVDTIEDARRVGPDLRRIASKLTPPFVRRWVHDPQAFRPSTRMPHFFGQENNRAEAADELDPYPERRTRTEAAAITQYLFAVSSAAESTPPPEGVTGDVSWGRELFKTVGCLACHANVAEFGEAWIARDITRRQSLDRDQAVAAARAMSYDERVRYALRHFPSNTDAVVQGVVVDGLGARDELRPIFTRFGPELSGVGSKVSFEWLYSWLMDPSHFSPDTIMPSLRVTPAEAAHLAVYLATLKNSAFDGDDPAIDVPDDAMVARLLEELLSSRLTKGQVDALLADEGGQLGEMLVSQLRASLGGAEARIVVAPMSLPEKRMVLLGSRMIGHYGCYGCHQIAGFEERAKPGTDLSRWGDKPIARLDFANFAPPYARRREANSAVFKQVFPPDATELIERAYGRNPAARILPTRESFARHKLLNPRIWDRLQKKRPYEKIRMGNFYLPDEEIDALVTFLLARKETRAAEELTVDYRGTPAGAIAAGRDLARERNCVACHAIDGNAVLIQQYYARETEQHRSFDDAPPSLHGEGSKVQSAWLTGFLNQVEPIRPWLAVRMPSFQLEEAQRSRLARYFVSLSREECTWIAERLERISTALDESRASARADFPLMDEAPWYAINALSDVTRELRDYAIANGFVTPQTFSPADQGTAAYAAAYQRVRSGAEKLHELHNVTFPAVDVEPRDIGVAKIADGETLFRALNCMQCHQFADPGAMDPNRPVMAPNLRSAHRRLRRPWIRLWLEQPSRIVAYTYMPDYFADDLTSPFARWAADERAALETLLHDKTILDDPHRTIRAITDFLFDAGAKGRTDIKFRPPVTP